jgi:ABC-2 type transport system ATP-binding protein
MISMASGDRVALRTEARTAATTVLADAGATVTVTGPDTLTVSGLRAQEVVARLTAAAVAFSEISAHRASLEEAYMELTREAVEFRAARADEGAAEVAR